ncbi:MAG: hypothetical protein ABFD60_06750, partial [Bryobacteraceae bacterium]
AAVRDAIWSPLEASEIELSVRADPVQGGLDLGIRVNPETITIERKLDHRVGEIRAVITQLDARGKVLESKSHALNMDLTEDSYRSVQKDWLLIRQRLQTSPEAFMVRVIVQDLANGALGSVNIPLSKLGR